jgi:hypothetical protein
VILAQKEAFLNGKWTKYRKLTCSKIVFILRGENATLL